MSELEVRPATVHDAPKVEPLVGDALGLLERLRGGQALLEGLGVPKGTDAASLATALCANALLGSSTLVATREGSVLGLAVLTRTAEGGDLVGIHTARDHRRQRIGTALLAASAAAVEEGGGRFEALALPGDQAVKSLLESAGYKARLLRMSAER